jgi:hypothetical protein
LERLLERLREQRESLLARRRDLDAMLEELDAAESACLAALAGQPKAARGTIATRTTRRTTR